MHTRYPRARSGPHSIHDARQYAWALLVLGPGAPPPRQRPHRSMLPDVPEYRAPSRPSLLGRLFARFRRSDPAGGPAAEDACDQPGSDWSQAQQEDHERLAA
jgi:hypothetical protein